MAVTTAAIAITENSATLTGTVNPGGAATTVWFEWGTDPALATYAATAGQSIGAGDAGVPVNATITGLSGKTTYHFRVCGSNGVGTSDGAILAFTTTAPPQPGPDAGQYFDRAIQAPGPRNYADNASHPLRGLTTGDTALLFGAQGSENCLRCHYDAGPARTSDECLKCHFENQGSGATPGALDPARHANGTLELAAANGNSIPTSAFPIASVTDYDGWCLQCHDAGSTTSLGGKTASGRTVIRADAFASGRHRAVRTSVGGPVGCIYCHHPHGTANSRLVRHNPTNRWNAGRVPMRLGVFPNDNTGSFGYNPGVVYGSYPPWQDVPYRARIDNDFADAGDNHRYCNLACHGPTSSQNMDRIIVRDNTTGNFILDAWNRKMYVINGQIYSPDNTYLGNHGHVNYEIISTDDMVQYYAAAANLSGPSYYRYPSLAGSDPALFGPVENRLSPLPFFPDYPDGDRDFPNGYFNKGPIRYRLTCSTCHDPHGTTLPNSYTGAAGFPDLRMSKNLPSSLCAQCHR